MSRRLSQVLQLFAVTASLVLTPLWVVIGFAVKPWIVPEDHDVGRVQAMEVASKAAFSLSVICLLTIVLAAGVLGNRRHRWIAATVLITGIAAGFFFFLPLMNDAMHVMLGCMAFASLIALVLIAAKFGLPDQT